MKTEFLKGLELTDEQIKAIQAESGKDVEAEKEKTAAMAAQLEAANNSISDLQKDIGALKALDAEGLQIKIGELEQQLENRKAEDEKAEREANILSRYNAVSVDKDGKPLEWSHEAIKSDYLKKFTDALADKSNAGKSDADIFHTLTKDDGAAFKVPVAQTVVGGANNVSTDEFNDAQIRSIMGLPPQK